MKIQSRALVGMMNAILKLIKPLDDASLREGLTKIAKGHCHNRGVRAWQYPIVGEIVLATYEKCLGDGWDEQTRVAWIKIFSIVLSITVPAALAEEKTLSKEELNQIAHEQEETSKRIVTSASTPAMSVKGDAKVTRDQLKIHVLNHLTRQVDAITDELLKAPEADISKCATDADFLAKLIAETLTKLS